MALIDVQEYLKNYGLDKKIIVLSESSATVSMAAKALHVEESSIAKSLSFFVDSKPIIIVTAGDMKIDNAKYKQTFHEKAKMINSLEVEKYIGHSPGGVCPFGIKSNVKVYLDESLKKYDYVYPACGTSNSAIKLSIHELEKVVDYEYWIDVAKKLN